ALAVRRFALLDWVEERESIFMELTVRKLLALASQSAGEWLMSREERPALGKFLPLTQGTFPPVHR
ncbi:MAG: hypothetical protein ACQETX_13875, partial [Pseudomonadota bacterium]